MTGSSHRGLPPDPVPVSATVVPSSPAADLEAVLRLLRYPADPATIAAGADPARRAAALWEHLAAWTAHTAAEAADQAGMSTDERIAVRGAADATATAAPSGDRRPRQPAGGRLDSGPVLALQQHRLTAVTHAVLALRGARPHPLADAGLSTVDAAYELLDTWRTARPTHLDPQGMPIAERVRLAPLHLAIHRLRIASNMLTTVTRNATPAPP